MKKRSGDDSGLRRKSEERLRSQVDTPEEISVEDAKSLIHELRVHQIELEMQNEELRHAHVQIEESRKRYADLYDFAPVGYLALDDKGQVLEANLTAAAQLGIERASLVETIFPLYVNPKDRQQARLHIMTVFKTKGRQTCELRLKPKGGEEFFARLESVFIENANGEGRCRTSISDISYAKRAEDALHRIHDEPEERIEERTAELTEANERLIQEIAERKQAEEALRESEAKYHTLFNSLIEGFCIIEMVFDDQGRPVDYRFLEINPEFEKHTGLQNAEGKLMRELAPDHEKHWFEIYGNIALTGEPTRFENEAKALNRWYEVYAVRHGGPESRKVAICFSDITERKRAEEALRESERVYRAIGESIDYGIWICDHDGRNIYSSESFLKLVGITQQECSDFGWGDVLHPEDAERTIAAWQECVRTGGIWDIEHRFLGVDGQWHPILARGVPVKDESGEIVFWAGINLDISERKKMEDELRKSRDELELRVQERTTDLKNYMAKLEQSNQALQDFASIAAHDLKEPLRKVISFGNMLRQKSGDSLGQTGNDYLDRMLNATGRMQSLLWGLLDYSRVATAAEPFKEVDLSDLIGEVISDLEVRIVTTGGEVNVGTLPVVSADPTQMRQLFQNLIGNALKFHKPGEKPIVRVHSISNTDSAYQIIVEDNGIGFDEQYLERIFAPFQRLHGRSSQYEGTGMGLAICKKIVERHGGSITAKSTSGAGSTFIVTLPLKP